MIVGSAAPSPTPPRVHGDIPVGSGISRAMATTSSIVVVIAMTLFSSTKFILFGNDTTHHPPVTTQGKTHSSLSSSSHHVLDLRGSNRRRLPSLLRGGYADPKTVDATNRPLLLPEESFVIPAYRLDELRHREPTVVYRHPPDMDNNMGVVVDVLSIGSNTRPEYLTAQVNTWASHANVRNFWGFTERDDYDPNCAESTSENDIENLVERCRSPATLWNHDDGGERMFHSLQNLRETNFGLASGKGLDERHSGWFCAQRRHGRALGWLRSAYRNSSAIPDVLLIVDDDTSVDIEKMKRLMEISTRDDTIPYVGAPCVFRLGGFSLAFGGFGTFMNGASIENMARPISCDDDSRRASPHVESVCSNLIRNRVGELEVFREGDSVFDVFYKYSALRLFCMHSDWAMSYMIGLYSGGGLHQLWKNGFQCTKDPCTLESVACHNQGPNDMIEFTLSHNSINN